MNCGKCGAENPDGSVYCSKCGARIDGKKLCPKCGATVADDSVYCNICGARIDGKKTCPKCGMAYDGNFCPKCGASAQGDRRNPGSGSRARKTNAASAATSRTKKIPDMIGGGLAMAAVLFSVIFVFFVGTTLKADVGIEKEITVAQLPTSTSILDYFYDAADSIHNLKNTIELKNAIELNATQNYVDATVLRVMGFSIRTIGFYAVFNIVMAALTLAAVLTFAAVAVTLFVRKLLGKTERSYLPYAFACVMSLACGAVILFAPSYIALETTSSGVSVGAHLALNGSTVAGITLGMIFGLGSAVMRAIVTSEGAPEAGRVVSYVFGLITFVFAVIAMFLMPRFAIVYKETDQGTFSKATFGPKMFASSAIVDLINMPTYDTQTMASAYESLSPVVGFSIASLIMTTIAAVLLAVAAAHTILSLTDDKRNLSGILGGAIAFIASIFAIVFLARAAKGMDTGAGTYTQAFSVSGWATACVVLTALLTALAIIAELVRCFMSPNDDDYPSSQYRDDTSSPQRNDDYFSSSSRKNNNFDHFDDT